MTSWEANKLSDITSYLSRGVSPSYVEEGGICVLNQKCIRDHCISTGPARRHDAVAKKVDPRKLIQMGDVLVNSTGTGTLGRVAQVREVPAEATTVDSHITLVRPRPGLFFPDFFGYMMIMIEEQIKEAGEGASGQTELARTTLAEKFEVRYPSSLGEQKRIVHLLDESMDDIATATRILQRQIALTNELQQSILAKAFSGEL